MKTPSALEQLTASPIERPCEERWDQMVGDDRVRHCARCARDVYDLSEMSPREAELRLLNAADRAPCIRYARLPDGTVLHAAEPRHPSLDRPASRPHFMAAAALGVTLTASAAGAKEPKKPANAPAQCVAWVKQSDVDAKTVVAAAAPAAQPNAPAASAAFAETPSKAPPPPPPVEEPMRLGGAVAPPRQQPAMGTLSMKSKVAREVTIIGIKLQAPFDAYLLSPGDFIADVKDPDGTTRAVKLKIKRDKTTTIDLDRKQK